jgi:hypothetical protein
LADGALATGYPHAKNIVRPFLSHTKISSRWIKDINIKGMIIKLLKEIIEVTIHVLGFGDGFSDNNTNKTSGRKK